MNAPEPWKNWNDLLKTVLAEDAAATAAFDMDVGRTARSFFRSLAESPTEAEDMAVSHTILLLTALDESATKAPALASPASTSPPSRSPSLKPSRSPTFAASAARPLPTRFTKPASHCQPHSRAVARIRPRRALRLAQRRNRRSLPQRGREAYPPHHAPSCRVAPPQPTDDLATRLPFSLWT